MKKLYILLSMTMLLAGCSSSNKNISTVCTAPSSSDTSLTVSLEREAPNSDRVKVIYVDAKVTDRETRVGLSMLSLMIGKVEGLVFKINDDDFTASIDYDLIDTETVATFITSVDLNQQLPEGVDVKEFFDAMLNEYRSHDYVVETLESQAGYTCTVK